MSNFQDIVADAEKEAKKKLDEYRTKQEAELQAKQAQADLDKRIADRELELRREQYLKDKFSSDPDKYTKAMVANSISTRINVDKLITDFKPSTSTTSNRTTTNEETEPKENYFKMFAIGIAIVAVAIGISLVLKEKDEKIATLTKEQNEAWIEYEKLKYHKYALANTIYSLIDLVSYNNLTIYNVADVDKAINKVVTMCGTISKRTDESNVLMLLDSKEIVFLFLPKDKLTKEVNLELNEKLSIDTYGCAVGKVFNLTIGDNGKNDRAIQLEKPSHLFILN